MWDLLFALFIQSSPSPATQLEGKLPIVNRVDGYRGIWYTLNQFSEYGDKYSGGLGTYTANHIPIAAYAKAVNKTFFVYGGSTTATERHLLCMAGSYDHTTGMLSHPVVIYDKRGVDDPHDNPCLNIDPDGYIYIFVSGRNTSRLGFKYRSKKPYDLSAFDRVEERDMTYPQLHVLPQGGMIHLFTKYTAGRELYWQTSEDGKAWTPEQRLAGFGGHYQVTNVRRTDGLIASAFMYHPGGNVDKRTNLYYLQSADRGKTWTTVTGQLLAVPLNTVENPALLIDYEKQKRNVYIHDLNFDAAGNPVILYNTASGAKPGPSSAPFTWHVTFFDGKVWHTSEVTTADHSYDTGALCIEGSTWRVIGPTGEGPQKWGAGGEMSLWTSTDSGKTWTHTRQITNHSESNHSYARRPVDAHDDFYALWADGDPGKLSPSRLYFTNKAGTKVS